MNIRSELEQKLYTSIEKVFPNENFIKTRPEWLKNPETNRCLELDFYCENLKIAIEVQGYQHYTYPNHYHKTDVDFQNQIKRDELKKKLCQENNITLVCVSVDNNFDEILNDIKRDLESGNLEQLYDYIPGVNYLEDIEIEINEIKEKVCNGCHVLKKVEEFYQNTHSEDGYYSICKSCKSKRDKERYLKKKANKKPKDEKDPIEDFKETWCLEGINILSQVDKDRSFSDMKEHMKKYKDAFKEKWKNDGIEMLRQFNGHESFIQIKEHMKKYKEMMLDK